MSATVIISTTGSPEVIEAIKSVLNQTYDTKCYIVCDGPEYTYTVKNMLRWVEKHPKFHTHVKLCNLPINVGANGFYGHRVYASFPHLVDTDYVLYLDHDNVLDENHVQSCVDLIEKNNLDWCYSLRKIINKQGEYLCNDDCESLGKWQSYHGQTLIDTSCYCVPTKVAIKTCHVWHGGWGVDRLYPQVMMQHFPKFDCTGEYTVNYRVDGNAGSVNKEFFDNGNKVMEQKYNGKYPWKKSL